MAKNFWDRKLDVELLRHDQTGEFAMVIPLKTINEALADKRANGLIELTNAGIVAHNKKFAKAKPAKGVVSKAKQTKTTKKENR